MVWLPSGEKTLNICLSVLTECTNVTWHTDILTHRHKPHESIGRACIASRGKNRYLYQHYIKPLCSYSNSIIHTKLSTRVLGTHRWSSLIDCRSYTERFLKPTIKSVNGTNTQRQASSLSECSVVASFKVQIINRWTEPMIRLSLRCVLNSNRKRAINCFSIKM